MFNSKILSTAAALMIIASLSSAQVLVEEVSTGAPDFVELFNQGGSPVDISAWTIDAQNGTIAHAQYAIPGAAGSGTTMIMPGEFKVFQELGTAGSPGTLPNSTYTGFNWSWVGTSDVEVLLLDDLAAQQDYVYRDNPAIIAVQIFSPPGLWTGALNATGDAIQRIDPTAADTNDAADWRVDPAAASTPGAPPPPPPFLHSISSAPNGMNCDVTFAVSGGTPGDSYYIATTVNVIIAPPAGWFFGIDLAQAELVAQLNTGFPFVGVLDATGGASTTISVFTGGVCPIGIPLASVGLTFAAGTTSFITSSPATLSTI